MGDGQERPIAFGSRTLNQAEKKYSQLEKEGLAIIFGVKKFHSYIYVTHFTFSQTTNHSLLCPVRSKAFQSWHLQGSLTLAACQYSILYKAGKSLNNADALSRLPQPDMFFHDSLAGDVIRVMDHLSTIAISCPHNQRWTSKDPTLSQVRQFVLQGFPATKLDEQFNPYQSRAWGLSVIDGCLLWGARMVVPPQGRLAVLNELHSTHPGCRKMKSLARCYIWWPKMDSENGQIVKQCQVCQESRPSPPVALLHPWEWPSKPWSRLHLEFAGPFFGKNFLVLVDAHSKWVDIEIMTSITSSKTIEKLCVIFSTHGLP